jgi:hypothetical protein
MELEENRSRGQRLSAHTAQDGFSGPECSFPTRECQRKENKRIQKILKVMVYLISVDDS